METTTATGQARRHKPALDESTLCGAFQVTAAQYADRVAIRTKGDEVSITWGEYADRVRRLAGGLSGLGLERGDTVALMLNNRPEFHIVDMAAVHLGATPFSVYNTYSPEQIQYLVSDAGNRIIVTEQAYVDTVLKVKDACDSVEHVVVVDGGPDGTLSLDDVDGHAKDG